MAVNRDQVIQGAERHVARGKLESAILEYQRVLNDAPRDANTLNRVGDLWLRLGKVEEAKKVFVRTATVYVEDGFLVKAIAMYKKIIKCDPSGIEAYERLASLYHRQGLLNEARTQYQVLADYYFKHQDPTAAAAMLERAVELEPENPNPRARLAELYQQLGAVERSSAERRKIAELLLNDGHEGEALKVLQGAVALRPGDNDFAVECVRWLSGQGRKGAAVRLFAWAAEKWPSLRHRTDLEPEVDTVAAASTVSRSSAVVDSVVPAAPAEDAVGTDWALPDIEHPSVPSGSPLPPPDVTFAFEPLTEDELREASAGREIPRLGPERKFESVELELEDLPDLHALELGDDPSPPTAGPAPSAASDNAMPERTAPAARADTVGGGEPRRDPPHLDLSQLGQAADEIARRQAPRPQRADEAVAEAEVLARYGLVAKAIERLRAILRADPSQNEAHRALVSIFIDHSRLDRAAEAATQMAGSSAGVLSSSAWQAVRAQLLALGFQIHGRTVLPPADALPRPSATRDGQGVDALLRGLVRDRTRQPPVGKAPAKPPAGADVAQTAIIAPISLAVPSVDKATAAPVASAAAPPGVEPSPEIPPEILPEVPPESAVGQTGEVKAASDWLDLGDLSAPWTEIPLVRSGLSKPKGSAPSPPGLDSAAKNLFEDAAVSWLQEAPPPAKKPDHGLFTGENEFFDLAAELEKELSDERSRVPVAPEIPEQSLEEILATFKRGVAEVLSSEDYDTHFNLGIAYREMGLTDEAIGEFQLAARAPQHLLDCCSLLGLCFLEKGIPELAVKWYRRGLDSPGLSEEQGLGLRYELGNALVVAGEKAEAYKVFVDIYGGNSNYRDVVARVAELRPR